MLAGLATLGICPEVINLIILARHLVTNPWWKTPDLDGVRPVLFPPFSMVFVATNSASVIEPTIGNLIVGCYLNHLASNAWYNKAMC